MVKISKLKTYNNDKIGVKQNKSYLNIINMKTKLKSSRTVQDMVTLKKSLVLHILAVDQNSILFKTKRY